MNFPESPHLKVGKGRQVGVITLWTKKEHILEHLPEQAYAVCSQLYSRDEGISLLIRSLLENKQIRDLIITGSDLNGCSDALIALWKSGVKNGMIVNGDGYVDAEIPPEAIQRLTKNVKLHDKREVKDYEKLAKYIQELPEKEPWGKPETFPKATIKPPEQYPAASFHPVRTENAKQLQRVVAERIKRFGNLYNATTQVTKAGTKHSAETEKYVQNFISGGKETYGYHVNSELQKMRMQYADTNYAQCIFGEKSIISKIAIVDGHVQVNARTLTLEELPMMVEAGFALGEKFQNVQDVTINAEKIISKNSHLIKELTSKPIKVKKIGDPSSNFLIRLVDGKIQITHLAPDGKRLEQFQGESAEQLYMKILREQRVTDLSHAAYIGYELGKAEEALKSGGWYEQDAKIRPN